MATRARKTAAKSAKAAKPAKPLKSRGDLEQEAAAYTDSLRRHGQLHEGDGPLPPGATHVVEKDAKGKPAKVVRKRFSAI